MRGARLTAEQPRANLNPQPPSALAQVWDLSTLQRVKTLAGHTDAVRALAVSDGRLFSGSYDGTVRVWDEATLSCLEILKGHSGPVRTLVHAAGCMFSGSYDKTVRVWDAATLECKAALTGHTGAVRALVASPDQVFSGSDDTTIKVRGVCVLVVCVGGWCVSGALYRCFRVWGSEGRGRQMGGAERAASLGRRGSRGVVEGSAGLGQLM